MNRYDKRIGRIAVVQSVDSEFLTTETRHKRNTE